MRLAIVATLIWLTIVGAGASASQNPSTTQPGPRPQPPAATMPAATQPQELPAFESHLNVALQKAKADGKVLILELYKQDCPYCARMMKSVYPQPDVLEFSKRFVWLRLDQDLLEGNELRRRYQAGSTPMYIAIGQDGTTPYYRFSGAMSRKAFEHNLGLVLVSGEDVRKATTSDGSKPSIGQRLIIAKGELMAGRSESAKNMLQQIADDDPANESGLVDDALVLLGMVKNAQSRQTGPQQAYLDWAKVIKMYPTSDRGPDAVMYVGKMMRDAGRRDKVDQINPLIKDYPEGVDVAGCAKVLDGK